MLCEAQQNFAKSTQVLEQKIEDKSIFLDIINQVQLPSVQVHVRTVEELERLEGKTYRELTLMCHPPNFKRINPNAKEQTRTMAAYIYCILYEQITGIRASQTGCITDFRCPTMPFKRLITGKRQPGGPGRSSEARGGSSRSLEEVAEMEGPTPTKRTRKTTKSANQHQRRVRRLSKPSQQVGRIVRLDVGLGGRIKSSMQLGRIQFGEQMTLHCT